jgi:uncharacterized protein with FMN-binding domain
MIIRRRKHRRLTVFHFSRCVTRIRKVERSGMNRTGKIGVAAASMTALALDVAAIVVVPQLRIQQSQAALAQTASSDTRSSSSGNSGGGSSNANSTPTSGSSSSSSSSSSSTSSTGLKDGTYTGAVTATGRGDVQIKITVSNGSLTAVNALQYPQDNPESSSINQQVIPVYVKEALTAQSASIQAVSGATETYDGFTGSLQDAINQAKS